MLCVIAKLNEEAREKLSFIAEIVSEFNIAPKQIHGHFTLVTYIGNDEIGFIKKCKKALQELHSFSVTYEQIKVLSASSIIVASPQESKQLISIHHLLSSIEPLELNEWTTNGNWEAHTTLLYKPQADLYAIANRMNDRFVSFSTEISCIEFSKVLDEGYTIIDTLFLSKD